MNKSNYNDFMWELNVFNSKYPRPNMPPLKESLKYFKKDWPKSWYGADKAGVYLFFNENDELIYIGKASSNQNIGNRLGSHFKYNTKNNKQTWETVNFEENEIHYVVTIPILENGHEFEAPAIEEYLISKLNPTSNTHGRTS